MKKLLRFAAYGFALAAAVTFTGCSNEDEPFYHFDDETPQTRASVVGDETIITFDDFASTMMAMPTSYGANYYGDTGSYAQVKQIKDPSGVFESSINII